MTTKQSARLHRKSVNRDCFVVLHTLHHLSVLLAMTRSGLFQQSFGGDIRSDNSPPVKNHGQTAFAVSCDGWCYLYFLTRLIRLRALSRE